MGTYRAPVQDMSFVIDELIDVGSALGQYPQFTDFGLGPELTTALLDEAGKFASDAVSPLRRVGDQTPAVCRDKRVITSPGYDEVLQQLGAGGWMGISAEPEFGGQGLPELYGTAAMEMWHGADMAFSLAPMLSGGAAMAIAVHGTEQQKACYLEKMYAGEWTGTMNLTESGAGSDLGVMKARAEAHGDHYRIYGQKIFITWGDHEATDNIIHLVLAKLPSAAAGSGGISLFIVPKYLINEDGSLGERNDVYAVSCEHKLGIHGSPTCVMAFGDNEGAIGYLLGEENQGLACMFTMMNEARLKVGLQGLGGADASYQQAVEYARERVQSGVPIIQHPDVKRMLLTMRSLTEAARAFAYTEAVNLDLAHMAEGEQQFAAQKRVDLMVPVIKGWITEVGQELTSLGVQVHGGMGYVEETGAAQYFRDVRITSIYEGTNGIQAVDLAVRKVLRDKGAAMAQVLAELNEGVVQLGASTDSNLQQMSAVLKAAVVEFERSTDMLLAAGADQRDRVLGSAFDYMMQCGYLLGGWHLARSAAVATAQIDSGNSSDFYPRKIATARFYMDNILPRCASHAAIIAAGGAGLRDYPEEWL